MKHGNGSEALGTVHRVIEILRLFGEKGELTLKEMSLALSLAPSTCHRLLELLGREGFIEQDMVNRRYRIGREYFRVSGLVQSKHDVRRLARPFLEKIVEVCDETVVFSIYVPSEGKIFFAEKVDSSMMLRYQLSMNTPMSALWGASGRSILAFLDRAEVDRIYAAEGTAPGSGETLPARRTLETELGNIRQRGYDITYGQKVSGAVGIGAPVFGADGKVLGGICITVPKARIAAKDRPRLGDLVRSTAAELSAALGASPMRLVRATA